MRSNFVIEKFIENTENGLLTESEAFIKKQQQQKFELYLAKSEIPSFYHNIDFEQYQGNKTSEAFKQIRYYSDNIDKSIFDHVSLYLWGGNGTQKTALACNIGKEAMRKGLRVKFILAGDLIAKFMKLQGYSKDPILQQEIDDLRTYDVILLDDCWDEEKAMYWKNSSSLIIAEWDIFLRGILANGVKVVMTSNHTLDIVSQKYGVSLFELLDRNFHQVHLTDSVKQLRKLNVADAFKGMK